VYQKTTQPLLQGPVRKEEEKGMVEMEREE